MILVDTSFFFPLLSARDRDHPRVRRVIEDLGNRRLPDLLLTTNHVVVETGSSAPCRDLGGFLTSASDQLLHLFWGELA